jgi:hypothetical protein
MNSFGRKTAGTASAKNYGTKVVAGISHYDESSGKKLSFYMTLLM